MLVSAPGVIVIVTVSRSKQKAAGFRPVFIKRQIEIRGGIDMSELTVKYNELSAEEFILLWETVWGQGPSLEQTELAMKNTLFRVSVYDNDKIVAMARMIGDMGLDYYIKDVVVRPEYQHKGIGRMLINE